MESVVDSTLQGGCRRRAENSQGPDDEEDLQTGKKATKTKNSRQES